MNFPAPDQALVSLFGWVSPSLCPSQAITGEVELPSSQNCAALSSCVGWSCPSKIQSVGTKMAEIE